MYKKLKYISPLLPLFFLALCLVYTILNSVLTNYTLVNDHYIAITLISINLVLLFWSKDFALLFFIIPLILGVFNFITFTPAIYYIGFAMPNISNGVLTIQPLSFFVLIFYFVLGSAKRAYRFVEDKKQTEQ